MRSARAAACALAAWACAGAGWAHAVRHEVHVGEAVVVALHYTDGEPFAFERYELFRGPGTEPVQSGRTDADGRLVLLPGADGAADGWRLRAYSADGHGLETPLAFAAHDGVAPATPTPAAAAPGWERVALGVCLILGLGALGPRLLRRRPR
ncbi:ABC transporter permease [Pseudorhodoferax sp.]|uniref:ABC transporter permease n=1 Tax=Pseudorhodoferax sp. TaxID=1993553 RepID=UPI002DD684E2|nr:ABC transporter permease [Pseudorhodoferax sp.]